MKLKTKRSRNTQPKLVRTLVCSQRWQGSLGDGHAPENRCRAHVRRRGAEWRT